ncbi:hypothetical protein BN1080_01600 [Planococcus massiliensis]|uniref:Uncharacterized protein n=1 Tax=Planococcus massiliensis TaxID=1499687 RepID=A0A098ELI1_9BACL|nr:hypothetical protein BN1080_01600 [Planococcus massiliensis]
MALFYVGDIKKAGMRNHSHPGFFDDFSPYSYDLCSVPTLFNSFPKNCSCVPTEQWLMQKR